MIRVMLTNKPIDVSSAQSRIDMAKRAMLQGASILSQSNVVKHTPVGDSGALRASIRGDVVNNDEAVVKSVGAGSEYAYYVEEGRAPGKMPPSSELVNWVRRSKKGRSLWSSMKSRNSNITAEQVAFILARKIGKKGTEGQKFFQKGIDDSIDEIERFADMLLDRVIGAFSAD